MPTTNPTRRTFLRTAPIAAAAGIALTHRTSAAQAGIQAGTQAETQAGIQASTPAAPEKFQLFTAAELADDAKALAARPGNNNLVDFKTATVVMTTESAHAAKEFEWHAGRDHIIQILSGTTVYEIGGTPRGTRPNANGKSGEYNSSASEGATRLILKVGDMLTIPRNTPHKRTTGNIVTFILISSQGMLM